MGNLITKLDGGALDERIKEMKEFFGLSPEQSFQDIKIQEEKTGSDKMLCDLHTHSTFSDGTLTPTEIIELAKQSDLKAVALTDHNTVSGLKEFVKAAEGSGIIAIPGAEFSTDYNGKELHVLGLFINESCFDELTKITEDYKVRKEKSNRDLINKLNEYGYSIDYDEIKKQSKGSINRANIAMALKEKGYVNSVSEAFKTILHPSYGFYKNPKRISATDMICKLKELGVLPILAHPLINLSEDELRCYLSEFIKSGLVGMEAYYSLYDENTTVLAENICEEFGLAKSGGSDFHGAAKPDIFLGRGRGNLEIEFDVYKRLALLHQEALNFNESLS